MRNDALTLVQFLTNAAARQPRDTPTAAAGWAPSAVWLLLRQNARASRKVRV